MNQYHPIIGVEVHVELGTNSKMFCGCPADHFGVTPNTHTCPVCLGLPGALPVPNKKAIDWTILFGLAVGCKINEVSKFDRKNYFYPDLPKGYQISQYDEPLCVNGELKITTKDGVEKTIRIRRVHLEEDTGKLQHAEVDGQKVSLADFNRSGVPLMEIVTEPDFESIEEVDLYLKKLQKIIRYLGISGADMEKGSMRLEPSISVRVGDSKELPAYRVELKNINSFRFARKGLEYEIKRQTEILEKGETPSQQTRGWSEEKGATVPQREKEGESDYRYFPEPDIPPLRITKDWIHEISQQMVELPDAKSARFQKEFKLSPYASDLIVEDMAVAAFFETAVSDLGKETSETTASPADLANAIINKKIDLASATPAELVAQVIASRKSVVLVSNEEIDKAIEEILSKSADEVNQYKAGKVGLIGYFMGLCIKILPGVDKPTLMERLEEKLAVPEV
jgi:aspartyl-tRNA(Asn)/glutamyl-tRNA(Gln) amidotransferase subunit B